MSGLRELFLILLAIYGLECCFWVRREVAAFRAWIGKKTRIVIGSALPGGEEGGLFVGNPLPPLGTVYVCQQWPLSLSPEAAFSYVAQAWPPAQPHLQRAKLVRFDELRDVQAVDKSVRVNGDLYLKTASPLLARRIARLLRALRDLPPARREKTIESALAQLFDTQAIEARIEACRARSKPLLLACNAELAHLFLVCPVVIEMGMFSAAWPFLAGGLVLLSGGVLAAYWRAHAALWPEDKTDRWSVVATLLLSPPAAIRANDLLTRHLVAEFHPLAVARVLCGEKDFEVLAEATLRDARFPAFPVCPSDDEVARRTEEWSRQRLTRALERFVEKCGGSDRLASVPPERISADCLAYCPRCTSQFTRPEGTCHACGDRPLVPFAGAAAGAR